MTSLVGEVNAVDVIYLDFSKAEGSVSHGVLLEKLGAPACTVHCLLAKVLAGWLGTESGGD